MPCMYFDMLFANVLLVSNMEHFVRLCIQITLSSQSEWNEIIIAKLVYNGLNWNHLVYYYVPCILLHWILPVITLDSIEITRKGSNPNHVKPRNIYKTESNNTVGTIWNGNLCCMGINRSKTIWKNLHFQPTWNGTQIQTKSQKHNYKWQPKILRWWLTAKYPKLFPKLFKIQHTRKKPQFIFKKKKKNQNLVWNQTIPSNWDTYKTFY